MNVLVITNLYPISEDLENDKNTKALHNIVKLWDCNTDVIRFVFLPSELKSIISMSNPIKWEFMLNNINIQLLPIWYIPKTTIYFYNKFISLVKKKKLKPDLIITHRLHCALGAARLANSMNKPFIIGVHNSDILNLKSGNQKKFFGLFEQAAFIACRSQSIFNEVTKMYPEFIDKSFIAFSGIEEEIINPIEISLNKIQEWKSQQRPLRFITAAVLRKFKNIEYNIKALAQLKDNIDWEYYIIGDGPELEYLKELVQNLGISHKVFFLGYKSRTEVLKYMEKSDIFIMVSSPETFGLSYIEAMAKGCLIIGAYNNGIDGVIINRKNGFLCTPGIIEEITEKIEEIANLNVTQLNKIILQSHKTISQYTESKAAQVYLDKVKMAIEPE
jgi:L-malate glycosyltransferase